ncbi:hypothetical protein AB7V86_03260 [Providencia rettgeri]
MKQTKNENLGILLSIKPIHANRIISGLKTIEIRRKIGQQFRENMKIFIYASSPTKKLLGSAMIDKIVIRNKSEISDIELSSACLSRTDIMDYATGIESINLIYLKNVIPINKNITISDIRALGITVPQSFCYINTLAIS